jgi:hypothetical protein
MNTLCCYIKVFSLFGFCFLLLLYIRVIINYRTPNNPTISLIFVSLFVIFALPVTLVISTWSLTPVISIWSARFVITFISVHYSFWFTTKPVIVTLRWLTPGALYLSEWLYQVRCIDFCLYWILKLYWQCGIFYFYFDILQNWDVIYLAYVPLQWMDRYKVPLVEQELPTPSFSGVCVTRSLVLCVCFVDRCLSFCTFSFDDLVLRSTASDYLLSFNIS